MTGKLIMNMAGQSPASISSPPMKGPIAAEPEANTDKMPRACACFSPISCRMIPIPAGMSVDVPTACTMRNTSSQPKPGENGAAMEESVTSSRPMRKNFFRPYYVAQFPHDRIGDGAGQVIGGNQPGNFLQRDGKILLEPGERHRNHRCVQRVQESAQANGRKEKPLA